MNHVSLHSGLGQAVVACALAVLSACGGNAVIELDRDPDPSGPDFIDQDPTGEQAKSGSADPTCAMAGGTLQCVPWNTAAACPVGEIAAASLLGPCSTGGSVSCGPMAIAGQCCYMVENGAGLCG
jgi:hypothetical protein